MQAHALVCDESQRFSLRAVRLPDPAPDQVAIRTHFSGVSIGTEFALIRGKLSWGPYPLCTGYMATGVIEAAGAQVEGFAVGDRVYVRGNDALTGADGARISSVSGTHCSRIVTRPHTSHGVALLPDGARMDTACMFVLPAVGLYGVDMANPRLGETVVVYGAGLIGIGVVAACVHRGCTVIAVDRREKPLQIARAMGADAVVHAGPQDVAAEIARRAPDGADVVFECTGHPASLDPAIALCRPHGRFVWQGNYGADPVSLHFLPPHGKRLQMFFPCDDGLAPCRRAVVKNMAMGALAWEKCITHRVRAEEAPELFAQIHAGRGEEIVGAVIDWRER